MLVVPGKNFPGEKGYPTPDAASEDEGCRIFRFPDDPAWVQLLMGAVQQLALPYLYYKWGELTPDEAADAWDAIINRAVEESFENNCDTGIPTPYWDDVTDLDDEAQPAEQTWYGIFDGTFQETVENFAIAGFIAYSGQVGAAISFLTIAPKFRLAWKTGNLGGIIRVIIDGAQAGDVDTYSATEGVLEQDFAGDPELEEHTVLQYLLSVP
jgi:hypothetical protein